MDEHQAEHERRPVQGNDVVWVRPEQFEIVGYSDGFALRIERFMGAAPVARFGADQIWVMGSYWDRRGWWCRPEERPVLVISKYQQRARWREAVTSA